MSRLALAPHALLSLSLTFVSLVAVGCGNGGASDGPSSSAGGDECDPDPSGTLENAVGTDGGKVESEGTTVDIPAGALGTAVQVEVRTFDTPEGAGVAPAPAFVSDAAAATVSILEPHGVRFAEPVTVTMTLDPALAADSANLVLLRLDDEADTTWEPVGPFTVAGDQLSFQTSTFSVILATQIAEGACPCWSGADLVQFIDAVEANGDTPYAGRGYGGWMMASDPPSWAPAHMLAMSGWGGWCKWQGPLDRWDDYFPSAPDPVSTTGTIYAQVPLDLAALGACNALGARALAVTLGTNLGLAASGLDAGDTVSVSDGTDTLALATNDALSWFPTAYATGEAWALTITDAPAGKTCVVSAPTGLFRDQNELVTVECVSSAATCPSVCDDLAGEWLPTFVETENSVITTWTPTAGVLEETTVYPAQWTEPRTGVLYAATDGSSGSEPKFWIQRAPDDTIEVLIADADADTAPFSVDERYTCDEATGEQQLQFSFVTTDTSSDWRLDITLDAL